MSLPDVVTREEWLEARRRLLAEEKKFTSWHDALNAERRQLPMVRIEKEYVFEGSDGPVSLAELFGESQQLVIQHVMFDPEWESMCMGCTASIDEMSPGLFTHLLSRNTTFVLVSRTPRAKIEAACAAKGWDVPWYSSLGSDFNYDFHVSLDASVAPVEYNYRTADELHHLYPDQGWQDVGRTELPGYSCFLRQDGEVFHTYSTFARGSEPTIGAYVFLDWTALGRQEGWEEPKGRAEHLHASNPTFTD